MQNEILTSIISGLCVAVPTLTATMMQHNATKRLLEYRLDKVEDKVGVHNSFEKRIVALETKINMIED